MSYDIIFEKIGFEDKFNEEANIEIVKSFLNNGLTNNLDISNLKEIIFTSTFKETVLRIQKDNNLKLGVTDNDAGYASGKHILVGKNHIIILNEKVLEALTSLANYLLNDKKINDLPSEVKVIMFRMINVFHHELCHVHDDNINNEFYKKLSVYVEQKENFYAQYENACIFWSEYIVNYFSASTIPQEANYNFEDICYQYKYLSPLISEHKERYFKNNDSIEFFNSIISLVGQFVKFCCYTLGALASSVYDYEKRKEIIFNNLSEYFSVECLLKLDAALQNLHLVYPNWNSVHILRELSDISVTLCSLFGVNIFHNRDCYAFEIV